MSGGRFNNNGYIYYQVHQFADELELAIKNNNKVDEYNYAPNFSPETINYLQQQISHLKKMAEMMRHIDYLYSGDHGEDSFLKEVNNLFCQ